MYTQIPSKNELVINAEEEKGEEEGRKTKQKTNGHGKHGEKKGKTGSTTTELPTNTLALSKISETNQEKSKSQKGTETRRACAHFKPTNTWLRGK